MFNIGYVPSPFSLFLPLLPQTDYLISMNVFRAFKNFISLFIQPNYEFVDFFHCFLLMLLLFPSFCFCCFSVFNSLPGCSVYLLFLLYYSIYFFKYPSSILSFIFKLLIYTLFICGPKYYITHINVE